MKIKELRICNIGLIENAVISIDKPLIVFYGDTQEGKTTYLNAVRWCFGGSFPADILRHGSVEGFVCLVLDDGEIRREWYVGRDGSTKARAVTFKRNGAPVFRPVEEIEKFLNPFLLDQNFLINKSEVMRKKYFADLFGVDNTALDTEFAQCGAQASELRAKISGFGEIDCAPVEPVDIGSIKAQIANAYTTHEQVIAARRAEIARIRNVHSDAVVAIQAKNKVLEDRNRDRKNYEKELTETLARIRTLRDSLDKEVARGNMVEKLLSKNPIETLLVIPDAPDLSAHEALISEPAPVAELSEKLVNASAQAVRYEAYQANLKRAQEKDAAQARVSVLEHRQTQIKNEKITRLAVISKTCGIPGLVFDPEGNFVYQGTQAGMLSTSQLMELSTALSSKYPAGFGLDLIDRGESLGTSIFKLIDRAKTEDKTILATVVGEKPASTPEGVGVFVVKQGAASAN